MTTQQIADRLVELCRTNRHDDAYRELFADGAASHEMPGVPDADIEGLDKLLAKSAAYAEGVATMHSFTCTDPLVYDRYIAVGMGIDVTRKDGSRAHEHEMCIYQVEDGKIVDERFVYPLPS